MVTPITDDEVDLVPGAVRCRDDCILYLAGQWPEMWWEEEDAEVEDEVWCHECDDENECWAGRMVNDEWWCDVCWHAVLAPQPAAVHWQDDDGWEDDDDWSDQTEQEANAARNTRCIAVLQHAFPSYCSHHLYHRHVRGRNNACSFGDEDKCDRGSHQMPDGFNPTHFTDC